MTASNRKKYLDKERTEWRKRHRTLNGKIIIYPDKPPEHINARASKLNNWFWKKILLEIKTQEIPAIISGLAMMQDRYQNLMAKSSLTSIYHQHLKVELTILCGIFM